jgi:NAD(P)-dependent dehydrogenase (short-subunit alcohol dehydrogenase family)
MSETAVVVGASGAMGQVIAHKLATRGLKVVAVARTEAALKSLAETSHQNIIPCVCDIGSDDAIEHIRQKLDGPVRMIVHGPGVATAGGVSVVPTSSIVDSVNIKVGGLLRVVRAADSRLVEGARIVAIGGLYGFEPDAHAATAGVCNAALANTVRQLSLAYGARRITAHLLSPGPVDTERLRRIATAIATRENLAVERVLDDMRGQSPIGAFTTVGQVAWAVALLLDPEADALAGSTLFLDAGRRRSIP